MEYTDNNAYDITECLDSDMICGIVVYSTLFLREQTDDRRATERTISQDAYNALLQKVWNRDHVDLRYTAPREWPRFSYLSE